MDFGCPSTSTIARIIAHIQSRCRALLYPLILILFRCYVYLVWNFIMCWEILSGKRESWIGIKDLQVVYEEDGLIVLNKHPNLLINDVRPWLHCLTLQMQLFFNRPHYANWSLENMFHFVNRLDYATSGLICIACDRFTAHILGKTFTKRMVGKQYLALVWGHVTSDVVLRNPDSVREVRPNVYQIKMALGAIEHVWPGGRMQKLVAPDKDPRSKNIRTCSTVAVVLEHGRILGEPATSLLLIPQTGRRHQLRVHCAAGLGHPIAGDLSYSPWPFATGPCPVEHDNALDYRLDRMMLHAFRLNLIIRSQRERALVHHHQDRKAFLHDTLVDKHQVLDLCAGDPHFFCPSRTPVWTSETEFNRLSEWRDVFTL